MASKNLALSSKAAEQIAKYWTEMLPLWERKVWLLAKGWDPYNTYDTSEKRRNNFVELKLYDSDIITLRETDIYALKSYFSTRLTALDSDASDNNASFGADVFREANEPPSDNLQKILAEMHQGLFAKVILSQDATTLIHHLKDEYTKNRDYYTFYIEVEAKSSKAKDNLSDQYFNVLLPGKIRSESFLSGEHYFSRIKQLKVIFNKINPDINNIQYVQFYSKATSHNKSNIVLSSIADLSEFIADGLEKTADVFRENIRISEDVWKSPYSIKKRHEMVLGIKQRADEFILPTIDESLITKVEQFKDKAKGATQVAIEKVLDEKIAKIINMLLWTLPDLVLTAVDFINDMNISIRNRADQIYKEIQDTLDTSIAYMCGFVNAVIDAVEGMISLFMLLFKLMVFILRNLTDEVYEFMLELIDEILQLFSSFNLSNYYNGMMTAIEAGYDKFTDKGADFIEYVVNNQHKLSNPRIVGYNLGYMVYEIVENYIPPLKLTKVTNTAANIIKGFVKLSK